MKPISENHTERRGARQVAPVVAAFAFAVMATALFGCATIPKKSYGIDRIHLEGVEELDEAALKACLATGERSTFGVTLGASETPDCGEPPFDERRLHLRLWRWPWSEWPVYDRAVFERDLERIRRWYRARGYYDTKILSAEFDPPEAADNDRSETADGKACDSKEGEGCKVSMTVRVAEGKPVVVESVNVRFESPVDPDLEKAIRKAVETRAGKRFDEAIHDRSKAAIVQTLQKHRFACAAVTGKVEIDTGNHEARVTYDVNAGPLSTIADVSLSGNEDRPARAILGAAYLEKGEPYDLQTIEDAQRAIYALGGISSVEIEGKPRRAEGVCTGEVDLEIRVVPGRALRYGLGGGIESGRPEGTDAANESPQWNIHLLAFLEHRNLFGGLRRFRLEDKPKVIFPATFPQVRDPVTGNGLRFGNELAIEFRQPAFIEPRTEMRLRGTWDLGPDPNDSDIFRHDLDAPLTFRRNFIGNALQLSGGIHANLYRIIESWSEPLGPTNPDRSNRSDYFVLFLEQTAAVDLRDNPSAPTKGFYLGLNAHEAGFFLPGSWDYLRLTGDVRGYIPLPLGIVIAARFGLGAMLIAGADASLDEVSRTLGPVRYRLRAGGPNSHRGFIAGSLGSRQEPTSDGTGTFNANDGGLRRWLGSLEVRIPITSAFGAVAFADVGDVNRQPAWRFNHLNLALGVGLRYQTIVGPLRFDMGFLIPPAAVLGDGEPAQSASIVIGSLRIASAIHITIGEAF